MTYVENRYNRKTSELKSEKYFINRINTLAFRKAIAKYLDVIKEKDSKKLNKQDWQQIAKVYYKKDTYINRIAIKRLMMTEVVQNTVNNKLIDLYSEGGLTQDTAKKLIKDVLTWIEDKKDTSNAIRMLEKYETAANLTHKQGVTARTTETIDYSRVGKDGEPAKKVTRSLEVSNQAEASGGDIESEEKT